MSATAPLDRLRIAAGIIVLSVWTVSVAVSLIDRTYNPPATIHLALMVVLGALWGPLIAKRNGNGKNGGGA